jgi:hypothetical protein
MVRHALGERGALVRDHVGHVRAEEDVAEEDRGQDRHRQPDRAARRLEQQQHADHRDDEVQRRRLARARRQFLVEQEQIGGTEGRHRNARTQSCTGIRSARRTLQRREQHVAEEDGERQVDGARLRVVEHEDAERERQRRGDPQLEQRPRQRHVHHDLRRQPLGLRPPVSDSATSCRISSSVIPDLFVFVLTHRSPLMFIKKTDP